MSLVPNLTLGGAGGNQGGYTLSRSLRFRSSASAYLDRNFTTPTNNKIYTWSGWVKKSVVGTANRKVLFSARNGTAEDYLAFDDTADNFRFFISGQNYATSSALFRDPSAWYHAILSVDTTQATSANRIRLYINGILVADGNSGNAVIPQNTVTTMNGAYRHIHGRNDYNTAWYFDGYLAEVNFIDGQALTPSSFGQTDSETGVWIPKRYSGTYGTNGFYLPFTNTTSATTLAYDASGNGNNWTANNISTTVGVTYDSMVDVPTLTSATVSNFCVLNPVNANPSGYISNGNLTATAVNTNSSYTYACGSISISSDTTDGYYFEATMSTYGAYCGVSLFDTTYSASTISSGYPPGYTGYSNGITWRSDGQMYNYGTVTTGLTTFTTSGDVIGVAVKNNKVWFSKNGTWISGDPSAGTSPSITLASAKPLTPAITGLNASVFNLNCGQRAFSQTVPTGFKTINVYNLPDPTIKKPNQYMDVSTWTGSNTTGAVTVSGLNFQPDFVWGKGRSVAYDHQLYDSVRGTGKGLSSNTTGAEVSNSVAGYISAFNSDGFTASPGSSDNAYWNQSTKTYVAWNWKESATAGFDIVTYTGTGSATTVAHSLGVAPKMIITLKRTGVAASHMTYHESLGASKYVYLDLTLAGTTNTSAWNNTAPTSSVFSLGTLDENNQNGGTFVAYLFAEIAGYSKFGRYAGNSSTDGAFVYTGFKPKYIMIKCYDGATNWYVFDSVRNTYNVTNNYLLPNASDAETSGSTAAALDILSNGFKLRSANAVVNGAQNYIYAAFAENPFKYSNAR